MHNALLHFRRRRLECLALLLLFALGAWLRLDRLATTTGFGGDQGEYSLAVMRWVKLGQWPMLGQHRAGTDDYNLSPGFFYTIAPALLAGRFHPAAGAALQVLVVLAGYALAWHWLRRRMRRGWPALLAISILLLAPENISLSRNLWNPCFLLFGLCALVWLMGQVPRHTAAALAGLLCLAAWLPGMHTTAYVQLGVAVPFGLYLLQRWQGRLRRTRRGVLLRWGLVVLMVWVALYLPPLLYELRGHPGTLATYLRNTLLANPPSAYSLGWRLHFVLNFMDHLYFVHFFRWPTGDVTPGRWSLSLAWLVLVGWMLWRRRKSFRHDPSPLYLAAAMLGYYLMQLRAAEYYQTYFLTGILPAPVLLAGWAVGQAERLHTRRRLGARAWYAVLLLALALLIPAARLWPQSLVLPRRLEADVSKTGRLVERIRAVADGRPYSLALLQPINYRDYLHALLWRAGAPPLNAEFPRKTIYEAEFGQQVIIVVRGAARGYQFSARGLSPSQFRQETFGDDILLCLDRTALPPHFALLRVECDFEHETNLIELE
jgi:hypothetical protein